MAARPARRDHRSAARPGSGAKNPRSLADGSLWKGETPVPFGRDTALELAAAAILPVLPLALTMIPLEELLDRLIGIVL